MTIGNREIAHCENFITLSHFAMVFYTRTRVVLKAAFEFTFNNLPRRSSRVTVIPFAHLCIRVSLQTRFEKTEIEELQ